LYHFDSERTSSSRVEPSRCCMDRIAVEGRGDNSHLIRWYDAALPERLSTSMAEGVTLVEFILNLFIVVDLFWWEDDKVTLIPFSFVEVSFFRRSRA
jgi:hypothetical protein